LGYDKYKEVSSEQAIRGTYDDRVVTVDGRKRFLIEGKAIGVELKDACPTRPPKSSSTR
jgi:hypothetical protein